MTATFEARYPGTCSDCEEPIRPGEQIASLGSGEYEHVRCRDEGLIVNATVCESCWLTLPCDCEADR